jgi:hypothetical protein
MAQFLNHINLNGNELRNFLVQPLGAAPPDTTWKLGRKYFDTTDGREQIYNGSKWLRTAYMSDIVAINDIANGVDERLKAIEAYFDSAADADNTINKWNEIVAFLNATEGTTLAGILGSFYTKDEIDGFLDGLDTVTVTPTLTGGDKIADITVGKTTKTIYAPKAPTLAGLMGNTAIGGTSSYIYWDGSKFVKKDLGTLAFKSSLSKSDVGLGNVENTALSTWTGSTNITTVGTIKTGTWQGSQIANAYLANSSVTIADKQVSLGGSLTAADLKTALGITAADIGATKKYAGAISKNTTTLEYTITHNLGTMDVVVAVYHPTTYEQVMVDVVVSTTDAVKIAFGSAPSVNYRVVVVG